MFDPREGPAREALRSATARACERFIVLLSLAPLGATAMAQAAWVAGLIAEWRAPGPEEPTGIHAALAVLAALLMMASVVALPNMLVLLVWMATCRAWKRMRRALAVAIPMWCAGALLLVWDPAGAWAWLME